jgi:hypothetical protein
VDATIVDEDRNTLFVTIEEISEDRMVVGGIEGEISEDTFLKIIFFIEADSVEWEVESNVDNLLHFRLGGKPATDLHGCGRHWKMEAQSKEGFVWWGRLGL